MQDAVPKRAASSSPLRGDQRRTMIQTQLGPIITPIFAVLGIACVFCFLIWLAWFLQRYHATPRTCATHGHQYEARYDEQPKPNSGLRVRGSCSAKELRAFYVVRVYVKDVCVRCGAEILRTPEAK